MAFTVTILGSGSALPTTHANQSAQVIEMDNQLFLMDCGEATQINLRKRKVKMQKIDHIFISHLHGDHYFGLVGLLSTMHLLGRKKTLHIHSPKGLKETVDVHFRNGNSNMGYEIVFQEVKEAGQLVYEDEKILVSSLPLKHRISCFGYKFQEKKKDRKLIAEKLEEYNIPNYARHALTKGEDFKSAEDGTLIKNAELTFDPEPPKSYAYCSDTAFYEKLVSYIKDVDLLYHEATFLDEEKEWAKTTYHSTSKQAAEIAHLSNAKKLIVGHFSSRYKNRERFLQEGRQLFKNMWIAEEGTQYVV